MATTKNNQTKFEQILSSMSLEDKAEVMRGLNAAWTTFKEKIEADGGKWIDIICDDEPLRNLFITSGIASQMWFVEDRKRELAENND